MAISVMEAYRRLTTAIANGSILQGAIELTANQLADVNREQLDAGRDAKGDSISPAYRSNEYAKYKYGINPKPGYGIPDLKDTGSYYSKIKFYIEGSDINFYDTDSKANSIFAKYGSVLGVYENTALEKYRREFLYPLIIQLTNATLGA